MSELLQRAEFGGRLALLGKVGFAIILLSVQGCGLGGKNTAALDATLTGALPPAPTAYTDDGLAVDGQAILAALSNRDAAGEGEGLSWENPDSGARGLITAYSGNPEDGQKCLDFTTTHENFSGIGLYKGTACEDPAGVLRMRELVSF